MKKGWEKKTLAEVAGLKGRIGWKGLTAKEYVESGPLFLSVHSLNYGDFVDFRDAFHITKERYDESPEIMLKKGDVLICKDGAGIGKLGMVGELPDKTTVNSSLLVIRGGEAIITKYLYFSLLSPFFQKIVQDRLQGATTPHLYQRDIATFPVFLPSMPEQEEIVEVLDKAFAAIDQAKANIEQNIANAKELFQSKLNQIFSQKGEGWVVKKLGEMCVVERGSSPRPIKRFVTEDEDGVNWVKIGDTNEDDKYVRSTRQKITKKGAEKSRFVDIGDFILSNSMSFGRPYIMAIQGYIHDGWFVLRLPEDINSDYFWQLLSSPYLKEQFNNLAAGAIVKNISGDLVKKAMIPIPPLTEQHEIYKETETLREMVDSLVINYQTKLDSLDELKKSILQKAFAGELT
jgi:type I restriction enzyme S subunit